MAVFWGRESSTPQCMALALEPSSLFSTAKRGDELGSLYLGPLAGSCLARALVCSMARLPSGLTGSASPAAFFGPVSILPRPFVEQSLQQRILLPITPESSPSGPDLIALIESSRVGPGLILCLDEYSWLA